MIYKYPLHSNINIFDIKGSNLKVLDVQLQDGEPVAWISFTPYTDKQLEYSTEYSNRITITLYMTGQGHEVGRYISTVQLAGLVLHYYET